jgi:transposase
VVDNGLIGSTCASARAWRPKKTGDQALGRSRGGPTTKIHLICDAHGNPLEFTLTAGNFADIPAAPDLLKKTRQAGDYTLADKGYDSDEFRSEITDRGSIAVIPGRSNRKEKIEYDKAIYRARSLVENAFCKLKRFRAVATRYDKLARNFAGMVTMACIMIWVRL